MVRISALLAAEVGELLLSLSFLSAVDWCVVQLSEVRFLSWSL